MAGMTGPILFLIPARGGSQRVPGKNLRLVGGIPLVGRAARTGLGRGAASPAVRTGSCAARTTTRSRRRPRPGAPRSFGGRRRSRPTTPTSVDVALHALDAAEAEAGRSETLVLVQPTSPLAQAADLVAAVEPPSPTAAPVTERRDRASGGVAPRHGPGGRPSPVASPCRGADDAADRGVLRRRPRRAACDPRFVDPGAHPRPPDPGRHRRRRRRGAGPRRRRGPARRSPRRDPCRSARRDRRRAGSSSSPRPASTTTATRRWPIAWSMRPPTPAPTPSSSRRSTRPRSPPRAHRPPRTSAAAGVEAARPARDARPPRPAQRRLGGLQAHARDRGLVFLSTPFDDGSADLLDRLDVPAFKVGSGELTNPPFLTRLARRGRPLLVSTGMADMVEVAAAVDAVRAGGDVPLALFHCVSSYPAAPEDANLRAIETMRRGVRRPDRLVGPHARHRSWRWPPSPPARPSSRSTSPSTARCPARTTRRRWSPTSSRRWSPAIRAVEAALGTGIKVPVEAERDVAAVARRSLHWAGDLAAGRLVAAGDLAVLRPGTGLAPARLATLVGRRTSRARRGGVAPSARRRRGRAVSRRDDRPRTDRRPDDRPPGLGDPALDRARRSAREPGLAPRGRRGRHAPVGAPRPHGRRRPRRRLRARRLEAWLRSSRTPGPASRRTRPPAPSRPAGARLRATRPDALVLVGDRLETAAAALAATVDRRPDRPPPRRRADAGRLRRRAPPRDHQAHPPPPREPRGARRAGDRDGRGPGVGPRRRRAGPRRPSRPDLPDRAESRGDARASRSGRRSWS